MFYFPCKYSPLNKGVRRSSEYVQVGWDISGNVWVFTTFRGYLIGHCAAMTAAIKCATVSHGVPSLPRRTQADERSGDTYKLCYVQFVRTIYPAAYGVYVDWKPVGAHTRSSIG